MDLMMKEHEFIDIKELSQRLKVPINTIYYWVSRNTIPYIKMGKHNRFVYQEVLAHFKSKTANKCERNKET